MAGIDTSPETGIAHSLSTVELADRFGVSASGGLAEAEAAARLRRFGPNVITREDGPGWVRRVFAQLNNPLIYVLLAAGVVTAAFGGFVDAGVIAGVVARNALDALSRMVPAEATVVRDGEPRRVPAAGLVPGDVVLLAACDQVPADVRLVDARAFEVDESVLTGESLPVVKGTGTLPASTGLADRVNMAHAGTVVSRGSARAVVVATGDATQLGVIDRLVAGTEAVATPLTRKLAGFARELSVVIVVVAAVVFVVGLVRGMAVAEAFTAVVSLAVGAIPEGLPAAVSIALALGVVRMSRRKAVVRHLPAVETLGGTTVICT